MFQLVKYFLKQCIIYRNALEDLDAFKETVISILVLTLNPFESDGTSQIIVRIEN